MNLLISFSGGETSAYMTNWIINGPWRKKYKNIITVFANTGQENEQTLEFVRECDNNLGFKTVWIEAVQFHGERKSPGHKIVSYETASRNGEPFEEAIKKYGIPNQKFKDCTRNLKRKPIESYAASIGWKFGTYDTAIGIRVDEIDRLSSDSKRRLVYPLAKEHPMTKPMINTWWSNQSFRLNLKGYQGNCKWCWKKSMRKHLTLISEDPSIFDFPRRMEKEHAFNGPEFRKDTSAHPLPKGYKRTFFRGNLSTDDLFRIYEEKKKTFVPASDDSVVFDESLDVGGGCSESCEVYSDDDQD